MTPAQFESLVDAMMDDAPPDLRALRDFCVGEVFKLSPLIDKMLVEARQHGRLETYFEIGAAVQREMRVTAKFDPVAMDETATPF